jgi:hypothetical protein
MRIWQKMTLSPRLAIATLLREAGATRVGAVVEMAIEAVFAAVGEDGGVAVADAVAVGAGEK